MSPKSGKAIVQELRQEEEKDRRENATFRISVATYEAFRKECSKQKVVPSKVLEKLMEQFVKSA